MAETASLTPRPADPAAQALTPQARERAKSREQRAEDIAYTINHSIYCTLTDFINPPVNAATDNWLRWLIPGCGHDHSKDGHAPAAHADAPVLPRGQVHAAVQAHVHGPHCNHGPALVTLGVPAAKPAPHVCSHGHIHMPAHATRWEKVKFATRHAFSRERFIQYAKGEFIGDFGAVPITIGMQRLFPGVMQALRSVAEPVMKPLFRWGVERSSREWAQTRGVDPGSEAYRQHVNGVYEHEMSHFPQAMVWTAASLGLNVGYQMHADKTPLPLLEKAALKSASVLSGVLVTAGVVVAARALAPHRVREFDQWTSSNFILPSTKVVGKIFGVDEAAVERMAAKRAEFSDEGWTRRVAQPEAPQGKAL